MSAKQAFCSWRLLRNVTGVLLICLLSLSFLLLPRDLLRKPIFLGSPELHSPLTNEQTTEASNRADTGQPFVTRDCAWVEPDMDAATARIKPLGKPDFPLLDAWLKAETARYGPAPSDIPPVLLNDYTFNGSIPVVQRYFDQAYLGNKALMSDWTSEQVELYRQGVRKKVAQFNYPNEPIYDALNAHAEVAIKGKRGLVIGSENPWLEAFLLEYGAEHVTTLEFGSIDSKHPQITTFTPKQFSSGFIQGTIHPFDFVFTYSSLEHDGLGRYGDNLNPSGDLQTMAKMLTVVKPGGFMFIGVPCCFDRLDWNAHRIYGPLRLPKMFAGWRILGVFPKDAMTRHVTSDEIFQPVWALQNTFGCKNGGVSLSSLPWQSAAGTSVSMDHCPAIPTGVTNPPEVPVSVYSANADAEKADLAISEAFDVVHKIPGLGALTADRVTRRLGLDRMLRVYEQSMQKARANPQAARWVVLVCRSTYCGGLGDRVKGAITSLYYGVFTNRSLGIDISFPDALEDYLIPASFDWRFDKSWATGRKTIEVSLIDLVDTTDHAKSLYEKADPWTDADIVFLHANMDLLHLMLHNPHWRPQIERYSLLSFNREALLGTVIRALFAPSPPLKQLLETVRSDIDGYRSAVKIGIQFRAGGGTGEPAFASDAVDRMPLDASVCYVARGVQFALDRGLRKSEVIFFITADSTQAQETLSRSLTSLGYKSFAIAG
ncbi:hypothetical protein SpCBS45565_g05735 [Spizellomyces sp. 'palustris']|nr:hypothetical protein SpCBS45565_g05735 [Spizellomyces sp. 'palustris']